MKNGDLSTAVINIQSQDISEEGEGGEEEKTATSLKYLDLSSEEMLSKKLLALL